MENQKENKKGKSQLILTFLGGILLGALLVAIIGWNMMPGMMIEVHESKYSTVEETVEMLVKTINQNGWKSPGIRDMNKVMAKHGVTMDPKVQIVELCNAQYAKDVLVTDPLISTLMPCAWGVYEQDGKIFISGMSMGIMGKMFGGNIATVMGGAVASEEKAMIEAVTKK